MANSDKNILITPNIGSTSDPKVDFIGANATTGPSTITATIYSTNNGTLSFDATEGSLFSITNNLSSGSIFSVNPISGIPIIDVNADRTISLNPYGGNTGIGTTNPSQKLDINGNIRLRAGLYDVYNQVGVGGSVLISTGAGVSWTSPFAAGLQGLQGTQGLQGSIGSQGLQGVQGLSNQGVQGTQGIQGTQGTQGLSNQGVQGTQGTQGLQGVQGLSNQGVQGTQGLQGVQGLSNQGVQGTQGLQGVQGLSNQGTQGTQGLQGVQGVQGLSNQGVQGTAGGGGGESYWSSTSSGIHTLSNVGIGTTNPTSKLQVIGDVNVSGVVTATSFSGSGVNLTGIVTSIVAGTNVTISGSTGQVTINSTGGSGGVAISTNTTNQNQRIPYTVSYGSTTGLGVTNNFTYNPSTKTLRLLNRSLIDFGTSPNVRIGNENTGLYLSLLSSTGYDNIFIGQDSGVYNTSGFYNIFLGNSAGYGNEDGYSNIFLGPGAGYFNTSGRNNNFIGESAGYNNTTGVENNFFGTTSGNLNISGSNNQFIGQSSGQSNTTGNNNIFIGQNSGGSNQTGSYNLFLGSFNGFSTSASYKVIIGSSGGSGFDSPDTTKNYQFAVGIRTDANPSKYWLVGNENFNVGIGTTNPTSKLQVIGDINVSGVVTATSYYGDGSQLTGINASGGVSISTNTTDQTQYLTYVTGTGSTTGLGVTTGLVFNPSSDNLGIGTINPTSKLQVVGDVLVSGITTASQLDLTANATANDSVLYLSGAPLGTNSTNGILGVGALNFSDTNIIANYTHDVNSYAQVVLQNKNSGSTASADFIVNNDRTAGTTYFGDFGINGTTFAGGGPFGDPDGTYLYSAGGTLSLGSLNAYNVKIATNDTERITILSSGNVGIGSAIPTQALDVVGNIIASGTVTASSDEKLKTNIKTIENALEKVLSLRGVEFDRIDNGEHQIGVIAQEVENIIPEVVYPKSPAPDYETKSVAYANLIGLLIEAIKEQNVKIEELERRLGEL